MSNKINSFVSPLVHSISNLLKNEDFLLYKTTLKEEDDAILRELFAAQNERDLLIVQGKYKMLRKIQNMPDDIINKWLAQEKQ